MLVNSFISYMLEKNLHLIFVFEKCFAGSDIVGQQYCSSSILKDSMLLYSPMSCF